MNFMWLVLELAFLADLGDDIRWQRCPFRREFLATKRDAQRVKNRGMTARSRQGERLTLSDEIHAKNEAHRNSGRKVA